MPSAYWYRSGFLAAQGTGALDPCIRWDDGVLRGVPPVSLMDNPMWEVQVIPIEYAAYHVEVAWKHREAPGFDKLKFAIGRRG